MYWKHGFLWQPPQAPVESTNSFISPFASPFLPPLSLKRVGLFSGLFFSTPHSLLYVGFLFSLPVLLRPLLSFFRVYFFLLFSSSSLLAHFSLPYFFFSPSRPPPLPSPLLTSCLSHLPSSRLLVVFLLSSLQLFFSSSGFLLRPRCSPLPHHSPLTVPLLVYKNIFMLSTFFLISSSSPPPPTVSSLCPLFSPVLWVVLGICRALLHPSHRNESLHS